MMDADDEQADQTTNMSGSGNGSGRGSGSGSGSGISNGTDTSSTPLKLPRIGNNRGMFLRDTIQSQFPIRTEQLQQGKEKAGKLLKNVGSQLSKIHLGKFIDQMESDQNLADSLEQLNYRMKEEVERQEVRREATELSIKVITDHLDETLATNPLCTYEDWVQDLHPENANQGLLFHDIQQIDERFYVFESDHRRLWNEAVDMQFKQQQRQNNDEDNAIIKNYNHRLIHARAQIWGKAPSISTNNNNNNNNNSSNHHINDQSSPTTNNNNNNNNNNNPVVDLISGTSSKLSAPKNSEDDETDALSSFAPTADDPTKNDDNNNAVTINSYHTSDNNRLAIEENVSEDLIKF